MATHSFQALYYPYIHFEDERWLKLAALYWDRMGRIVPSEYEPHDSPTVRALGCFVENVPPDWAGAQFSQTFAAFLAEFGPRLRERYSVQHHVRWKSVDADELRSGRPRGGESNLGYIFHEKITPDVREMMVASELAAPHPNDPRWIGMHPRLADVYMTGLAVDISRGHGFYPVTQNAVDHLAVGGWSTERLAQALLVNVSLALPTVGNGEMETTLAVLAIESVIPVDLDSLPIDRILEFRAKYPNERTVFQEFISNFVSSREWLREIRNPSVVASRLQDEYKKEVKPRLDEHREKLHDVNIQTVVSSLSVQVAVPAVVLQAAEAVHFATEPISALVAGAALALIPILRDRRTAQREAAALPTAYLLRAERNLKPKHLLRRIVEATRRFRGR